MFSLSLFSNSQILRSNKQIQSQQPCPPPHLPQFSQSQTPPPPPPIATPAIRNFLSNITELVRNNLAQHRPWSELVNPGHAAWVALAWVSLIFRVFFFFFFFFFFWVWVSDGSVWFSKCIFWFLGLGFQFDQFLFWIWFLGFLGLWNFEKGEWEKDTWKYMYCKCCRCKSSL